jgi:hypothetical protein
MNHQFSQFDNVLTIRLRGRGDVQELQQALAAHLGKQRAPLTVILDLTLSEGLDQNMKALFYRVFQHPLTQRGGVCGLNPAVVTDVRDLTNALARVKALTVAPTENELLVTFGLTNPPTEPIKLTGMLSRLKQQKQSAEQ